MLLAFSASTNILILLCRSSMFLFTITLSIALHTLILCFPLMISWVAIAISTSLSMYKKLLPRPLTITGTELFLVTKLIKPSPPLGIIRSILCVLSLINDCVSSLEISKYCTNSFSKPFSTSDCCHSSVRIRFEFIDSLPPFNKILFPALNAVAAASIVTSGRDSYIIRIVPNGTVLFTICSPSSRVYSYNTLPTGLFCNATSLRDFIIPFILSSSIFSLSLIESSLWDKLSISI